MDNLLQTYYDYYCNYINCINNRNKKVQEAIMLIIPILVEHLQQKKRKSYKKKRFWESLIVKSRRIHGNYASLFPLLLTNKQLFINYFRMSATHFEILIQLVEASIERTRETRTRQPISVGERLALTLRYVISGDSMVSLSYQFRMGKSTISNIIYETCTALWNKLQPLVLKLPTTVEWKTIGRGFESQWNFPNCIGAIDGKHIPIQAPANAGSEYYNYKGFHSIVLLAICDYRYTFTVVDIGANGRQSDGGIFSRSEMKKRFIEGRMGVPNPASILDSNTVLHFVAVGDQAFPLTTYLMTPYPETNKFSLDQRIFNYRLSRARRIIENTFGILTAKWRILRRALDTSIETIEAVVKATICLHNYLLKTERSTYFHNSMVDKETSNGNIIPGFWRNDISENNLFQNLNPINRSTSRTRETLQVRREFSEFFANEGVVPWQFHQIYQ